LAQNKLYATTSPSQVKEAARKVHARAAELGLQRGDYYALLLVTGEGKQAPGGLPKGTILIGTRSLRKLLAPLNASPILKYVLKHARKPPKK
jgi:hypothetical protein